MGNEIQRRAARGAVVSRCAMGAIALAPVVFSLWLLKLAAAADADCNASSTEEECLGYESFTRLFLAWPAWITAGLFVLGALIPAGTLRRLVMGFAVGLPAGIVIYWASAIVLIGIAVWVLMAPETSWLLALPLIPASAGFCWAFRAAYRRTHG